MCCRICCWCVCMGRFIIVTDPLSGLISPLHMLSSVDLPAPTGPAMPTISPGRTESDTFDKMSFLPSVLFMDARSIMKQKYADFRKGILRVTDRLYLRRYYSTIMYGATIAVTTLSVLFVFSLPAPLHPRTSIGLMTLVSISAFLLMVGMKGTQLSWLSRKMWTPVHYALFGYLTAVLLSLLFTKTIQDTTPLKLLLSGVAFFLITGEIRPTKREKQWFVYVIGFVAVCIATLGWLQTVFPDIMNVIAEDFLHGRNAYGITIEFNRGRLLHWGALIFVFPFFYASTLMVSWKSRFWTTMYIVYGYAAILTVMAVSNFRWLFLVFLAVSFGFGLYAQREKLISAKKLYYIGLAVAIAFVAGMIVARLVFGYNLLDRFLFRDAHRDITESLGRVTLYNQALTVFQAYPIFGAGYGNYFSVVWPFPHMQYFSIFDQFEPFPVPVAAHNEFYTVLAETGLLGFFSYLLLVYFIGKRIFILVFQTALGRLDKIFALTLGSSYTAIVLYIIFENMYPQNIAYLLIIGAIAHRWIASINTSS